ncbi:MAG: pentapeptide repeat-containing protein [Candidatus Methanofastidiosia archaeon]
MGRCYYAWEEWDREKGKFVKKCCQKETWKGSDEFCIFHDPSQEKDIGLFKEMLEEQIEAETSIHNFVGYCFPEEWDFSGKEFRLNVHFNGASFGQNVDFSKAFFCKNVEFSHAVFQGNADFLRATFQKAGFSSTTFQSNADFGEVAFQDDADFWEATFQEANFSFATFQRNSDFNRAIFKKDVRFYKTIFHTTNFNEATFQDDVDFNKATFQQHVSFYETVFLKGACFWGVILKDSSNFRFVTFQGDADFWGATFQKADFLGATFQKNAYFREVTFQGDADFSGTTIRESFDLVPEQVSGILDFRGAKFLLTSSVAANLRKAKFYRAYLQNVVFMNCVWPEDCIIYEEKHMNDKNINLSFSTLETIYRNLKQNTQSHGDYARAGEFYYREMEMRRESATRTRERVGLEAYKHLAGYGERYWNTAVVSASIVFIFAFLYGALDCLHYSIENPSLQQKIIDVIYFSFVTFTTLGLGDIAPATTLGKVLICVEAVIGAFMIAVFVVVFVRKMAR